mmetsp:Transcript_8321/g.26040  ORF Transcript_8321/g.26040 Transcript_8321/m.26040 type:complete len:227 (-) Transcript_8321:701-1381(-)
MVRAARGHLCHGCALGGWSSHCACHCSGRRRRSRCRGRREQLVAGQAGCRRCGGPRAEEGGRAARGADSWAAANGLRRRPHRKGGAACADEGAGHSPGRAAALGPLGGLRLGVGARLRLPSHRQHPGQAARLARPRRRHRTGGLDERLRGGGRQRSATGRASDSTTNARSRMGKIWMARRRADGSCGGGSRPQRRRGRELGRSAMGAWGEGWGAPRWLRGRCHCRR